MTKRKAYLQQKLKLVPKNPGVYIMYDAKGSVIYVGKAIKLKNRLQCYFGDNRSQPSLKVAMMIAKIYDFQYIICQNEQEALILESNLIKRHQPFYNILLKDDHDYPYIKVSLNESWPRVTKAYRVGSDRAFGAKYYGPYLNSQLQMALRSLEQIFPLASCDPSKLKRFVPCLNYQIGKCIGTCCKVATRDDYLKVIERVCKYLNGDTQGVLSYLTEAMNEAASQGKFEQAAFFRDRLFALKALHATQRIVSQQAINLDVLAICQQNLLYCIQKLEIRQGKITGASNFFISVEDLSYSLFGSDEKLPDVDASSNMQTDKAISKEVALLPNKSTGSLASLTEDEQSVTALLELFFSQHYAEIDNKPPNILLANSLNESILAQLKRDFIAITGQKCNFEQAKRGERYEWGKLALNNAREALSKKLLMLGSKISNRETALLSLQKLNNLKAIPHRIEAYDVANLGNDDLCAAMVCFIDGVYTPKNSLLFKLPNQNQQDDYLAMSTVLVRRLKHLATLEAVNSLAKPGAMELLKKADNLESEPDLILLDGGRGHQQAVLKALEQNFNWSRQSISKRLKIAGMVKNDKHETRALLTAEGEQLELMPALNVERKGTDIFLTSQNGTKQSTEEAVNLLRLLTKVQDEVHRLANDYYRKLQKKRILHYELQDIPGIGPKKCQLLLKHFKSTEAVKLASVAELEQVKGISHNNAEQIYEYYRLRQ
ncbi:excinuclease ABC subunit UvrC [Amygdalobacter nucleatus]|uniref:excinuclease ABC subunit UvrC n=1 Tax=Amygdalobacter nucleatus TaxID=3029274 RepID=UPI0027A938D4|nr:excinuclease ABC subunit UvrC [Amygdalobacter nucleatus]WEG36917.1 excinuclease ABC subunit UvrC [Amygdalobacter nucleatus]